jgi:hypothetical protein
MAGHELRIRSLDVQDGDTPDTARIWLDLVSGYSEPAEVRGEDDVVPEAAGREPGTWQRDLRRIQLDGHVKGFGGTRAERTAAWREATDDLMAVMQMHATPGLVEIDGEYLGIPIGETHFVYARCVRVLPGPILNRMSYQGWVFELECIDSPPEWQIVPS